MSDIKSIAAYLPHEEEVRQGIELLFSPIVTSLQSPMRSSRNMVLAGLIIASFISSDATRR